MIWDCSITITITLPRYKWQVDLPKIHISLSILLWFIFLANLISSGQTISKDIGKVKAKIYAVYAKAIGFGIFLHFVIVNMIGRSITIITVILQITKRDFSLIKPITILHVIVIWLEKVWLVYKSARWTIMLTIVFKLQFI